jgi:hypothetical protein
MCDSAQTRSSRQTAIPQESFIEAMISPVTQRPRARLDLLEQFVYFGEQANVELAERYFASVDETCLQLVKHPKDRDALRFRDCAVRRHAPISGEGF